MSLIGDRRDIRVDITKSDANMLNQEEKMLNAATVLRSEGYRWLFSGTTSCIG